MTATLSHLPQPVEAGKWRAALLAAAVHGLLGALLVWGVRWQHVAPTAVSVELIAPVSPAQPSTPVPAPPRPPEPMAKPEPAPPSLPKADIPIAPTPKADKKEARPEPAKPARDASKPKSAPVAPVESRRETDAERRLIEQALQQEQRQLLAQQAALEASRLRAQQVQQQTAAAHERLMSEYVGRIAAKVRGNIVLPPGVVGNPEAIFQVTQLPSGEVIEVRLRQSTGHPGLDAAIERALLKSSPLPRPPRAELFERVLNLKVRPLAEP